MERFGGRRAVVTAAASGIGRALSARLVAEGATVVAGDVDEQALTALQSELGPAVHARRCDVTAEDDVAALVQACTQVGGPPDLLLNVAGGSTASPLIDMTAEQWDGVMALSLRSTFFGVKHGARAMIAGGRGGVIINIASVNARIPLRRAAPYAAAKAGVVSLTESAALELAEHGVRVCAVSPGLTATPPIEALLALPGAREAFDARIPMRRPAEAAEIAAAALFLASDDASYTTGVNLFVDGGWRLSGYPDLRGIVGGAP